MSLEQQELLDLGVWETDSGPTSSWVEEYLLNSMIQCLQKVSPPLFHLFSQDEIRVNFTLYFQ